MQAGDYLADNDAALVVRMGPSISTYVNDGAYCNDVVLPFTTCGDKNGPRNNPNPDPVTDDECQAGATVDWRYNPAAALETCTGTEGCQVANVGEYSTCTMIMMLPSA